MLVVFRALRKWWYARCRRIDLDILWPICLRAHSSVDTSNTRIEYDLDHALAAFAYHCFNDPAWLELGEDELVRRIDALGDETRRDFIG